MTPKLRFFLLSFLLCASFSAAQTAVLSPQPKIQFLNSIGVPLAGGCVQTYAAGTTTPQASFTDSTGGVSNTNPVILDSAGRASIFLTQGVQYKFVLTSFGGSNCATGTLQYTQDNVALGSALTIGGSNTQVQYNSSGALAGSGNFTWNNATQTLTVGALVTSSGGTLAGTFTGSPTFSGNPNFTGNPQLTGGGTLSGNWAGGPTSSLSAAPTGASESGNTVTITTAATCLFVANEVVTISGVGVSSYNGTWPVASGCSGGSTFTYTNPTSGLGTSGSGTVIGSPVFSNGLSLLGDGAFTGFETFSQVATFNGGVQTTGNGTQFTLQASSGNSGNSSGGLVSLGSGNGIGSGAGGAFTVSLGTGGATNGGGGAFTINAGAGGGASGNGGNIVLNPGTTSGGTAGAIALNSSVSNNASGFKHKRAAGCATGATSGNNCETTVTWGTPFADANYTATCTLFGTATLGHLAAITTSGQAAASVKVQTVTDTNAAITGVVYCIAVHD